MLPPLIVPMFVQPTSFAHHENIVIPAYVTAVSESPVVIPDVPFFSQFADITPARWKKVGCGIASLAMIIEYYKTNTVSVDTLLNEGIASGAYNHDAGWIHQGLINLSHTYGLDGHSYDLSGVDQATAWSELRDNLEGGPVIASVHYKFDPKNPIPHLVVIAGVDHGIVYYNDPAGSASEKQISSKQFLLAWKKKIIVIRPTEVRPSALALSLWYPTIHDPFANKFSVEPWNKWSPS